MRVQYVFLTSSTPGSSALSALETRATDYSPQVGMCEVLGSLPAGDPSRGRVVLSGCGHQGSIIGFVGIETAGRAPGFHQGLSFGWTRPLDVPRDDAAATTGPRCSGTV